MLRDQRLLYASYEELGLHVYTWFLFNFWVGRADSNDQVLERFDFLDRESKSVEQLLSQV